ncbi:MAG TPA: hypothetical protein VEA60_11720 [Allosphingosinicella sp.]|nr:hypothetical protein [Allosphingosinicella sp.]
MPKLTLASGRAFDAGLAAFAAASAGFVAFAMPGPVFSGLVEASRLPEILAAARPPLGDTARFAAVAAAALGTFVAVWVLMALLGRRPAPGEASAEPAIQVPRQRRADAHPDAPPRPPLLARDLGEPLELDQLAPEPVEREPLEGPEHRPLPGFLVPQEPEPETVAEAGPPEPDPQAVLATEPEPDAETESIGELAARLPGAGEASGEPLSQLVSRIEFGLARKRQALPAVDPLPSEPAPAEEPEKVGHRLRSAINDLQKIASSGT